MTNEEKRRDYLIIRHTWSAKHLHDIKYRVERGGDLLDDPVKFKLFLEYCELRNRISPDIPIFYEISKLLTTTVV